MYIMLSSVCMCVFMCAHVYVSVYICAYVSVHIRVWVYVCVHVYMRVCVCMWVHGSDSGGVQDEPLSIMSVKTILNILMKK